MRMDTACSVVPVCRHSAPPTSRTSVPFKGSHNNLMLHNLHQGNGSSAHDGSNRKYHLAGSTSS